MVQSHHKLQVFVSSTFIDLRDERQAAVEAILSAGHIPAGMELFAAGDQAQMTVIRHWIDESDVFMLILGDRYGSIESQTNKSYVELEYEYALASGKALFAVVKISSSATLDTSDSSGQADQLLAFRSLVQQKVVRFWRDARDIKLAIHEAMSEFGRRSELVGWVRGPRTDYAAISEEVARLSRENALLRDRLSTMSPRLFNGLTFEELFRLLATTRRTVNPHNQSDITGLHEIAAFFEHPTPAPLHVLWRFSSELVHGAAFPPILDSFVKTLEEVGLIELIRATLTGHVYKLTDTGRQFVLCLRNAYNVDSIEEFRA